MKQRLALAVEAPIIRRDEPLISLDVQSCELMQEEIIRLTTALCPTVLCGKHSVDEGLILGDRLVLTSPRPGRFHEDALLPFAADQSITQLQAHSEFHTLRNQICGQLRETVLNDSSSDFFGRRENGVLQH
ncbi:hypothetical protein [Primorskyibacter flagellatus]|uniref:Uncharacterized protein n=1 Tax=Primorskyibacter flagellatus TaxID=1387277 RepID=A0A1W2BX01_9RHOB|nr:hypothetical protein [Primorskyibacter flagellatus]SMC77048.1 hypothetical protein SAMN06295998_10530 [Primorskyibacter flagellatus]